MNGQSLNIKQDKLEKLKQQFPEVFTEDKVDWEKLKSTLGEDINFSNERYVLNWAGKSDAFRVLQTPTTATLIPDKNESVDFDNTGHVFIEGENLGVLKVLQKSYYGKVKMIYIDPPYNTGNDNFIYPDKFSESKAGYLKRIGDKDEAGYLLKEGMFRKNSKDSGHYHSNWLSMMYPRMFLAKNLLRDDGVIFVSIDDNEVHNLRMLMNEVFGEDNFFAQIIVRANSRGQTYKQIAKTHEYILVYLKRDDAELKELEKNGDLDDLNLKDDLGKFNIRELRNRNPKFGKHNRPNLFYPIYVNLNKVDKEGFFPVSLTQNREYTVKILPLNSAGRESCWRWGKETLNKNIAEKTSFSNLVAKKKNDGSFGVYEKYRKTTFKPKSIWEDNSVLTETGTVELKQLGFGEEFEFPKPVGLIKKCVALSSYDDDIILDFFAGSCTTSHAVLDLNKEDGGNRKVIMVQMPEKTNEKSEAYKAGYTTISDIGKERIRRVIKKIKENGKQVKLNGEDNKLDLGFKVFKLTPSNFKIWRGDLIENGKDLQKQLELYVDPIREGALEENMLFELLLKSGYDLNSKIEEKTCDSINYYSIDDGEMIIALSAINEKTVKEIVGLKPMKVICLDRLFENNDQLKTNTVLQMKDAEIKFKTI